MTLVTAMPRAGLPMLSAIPVPGSRPIPPLRQRWCPDVGCPGARDYLDRQFRGNYGQGEVAKAYVKANIRETEKGYHCKMPDLVAYPAGADTMMIGKPVDQVSAPLLLAELLYEFNMEVARRTNRQT